MLNLENNLIKFNIFHGLFLKWQNRKVLITFVHIISTIFLQDQAKCVTNIMFFKGTRERMQCSDIGMRWGPVAFQSQQDLSEVSELPAGHLFPCHFGWLSLGDFVNSGIRLRLWFIPGRWLMLDTGKASLRVWDDSDKFRNWGA